MQHQTNWSAVLMLDGRPKDLAVIIQCISTGHASIIGAQSGKVLEFDVRSKTCCLVKGMASKLQKLGSTQSNENFKNIVSSYVPKNRSYGRASLVTRVLAAVLQKNVRYTYTEEEKFPRSMELAWIGRSCGKKRSMHLFHSKGDASY